jgi:hypothetical protein
MKPYLNKNVFSFLEKEAENSYLFPQQQWFQYTSVLLFEGEIAGI